MGTLLPTEGSGKEWNLVFDAPGTWRAVLDLPCDYAKAPVWGEQPRLNPAYQSLVRVTLKGSSSPTWSPHHPTHGAVVLTRV